MSVLNPDEELSHLTSPQSKPRPLNDLGSRSQPISAWKVIWITIIKDLQIQKRYLPDLVGTGVEIAIRVLFFLTRSLYFLSGSPAAVRLQQHGPDNTSQYDHPRPEQWHTGVPVQQSNLALRLLYWDSCCESMYYAGDFHTAVCRSRADGRCQLG